MCVSMNICCVKLTEKFGSQSSVIIKLPLVVIFRSVCYPLVYYLKLPV
jgi:hypothetical protein